MKKLLMSRLSSKARMCLVHIIHDRIHLMIALSVLLGVLVTLTAYGAGSQSSKSSASDTERTISTVVAANTSTKYITSTEATTTTVTETTVTTNTETSTIQSENTTESTVEVTQAPDTSAESAPITQVVLEVTDCAEVHSSTETPNTQSGSAATDSDIRLLAALIQREGGAETYECKLGIASTVVNRMVLYGGSLSDILYAPGQFTTASTLSSTTPSDECIAAATEVLTSGSTLPVYVAFFRAGYYHCWGDQVPYAKLGSTYFSYSQATKEANS